MIRASGNSSRIAIIASRPFISGICKSIRVMSGRCARNRSIASRPLEASATKLMSGWVARRAAIPLRNRGWSSTARIRIELGPVVMGSVSSTSSPEHPTARNRQFSVCDGGRNGHFSLRAGVEFTPDRQLASLKFGAFVHTRQTIVSGAPASIQDRRINALAVVPYPQPKLPLVVANFHFDPLRVRVAECITQRLTGNPVDFVPRQRSEIARHALHEHPAGGRILAGWSGCEFFSKGADRLGNVAGRQ